MAAHGWKRPAILEGFLHKKKKARFSVCLGNPRNHFAIHLAASETEYEHTEPDYTAGDEMRYRSIYSVGVYVCCSDDDNSIDRGHRTHSSSQKRRRDAWDKLLPSLAHVTLQMLALATGMKCVMCNEVANLRCLDCGPCIFYCEPCCLNEHQVSNRV